MPPEIIQPNISSAQPDPAQGQVPRAIVYEQRQTAGTVSAVTSTDNSTPAPTSKSLPINGPQLIPRHKIIGGDEDSEAKLLKHNEISLTPITTPPATSPPNQA